MSREELLACQEAAVDAAFCGPETRTSCGGPLQNFSRARQAQSGVAAHKMGCIQGGNAGYNFHETREFLCVSMKPMSMKPILPYQSKESCP